ncbi:unnamed protein product [Phytomonas sp. EM1]|nr:unnamed protein product [Phytomonas sp. EM1]|eukprot:CCW63497.1 unnamed protein product [Phytomonas sp. isolate EM1]
MPGVRFPLKEENQGGILNLHLKTTSYLPLSLSCSYHTNFMLTRSQSFPFLIFDTPKSSSLTFHIHHKHRSLSPSLRSPPSATTTIKGEEKKTIIKKIRHPYLPCRRF